jgi:signal transduction histidine kinase
MAFLSAAQLLLVGLAAASVDAPSQLLAVSALAQAPIVIGAAAAATTGHRRRADRPADQGELMVLASRVESAEATLLREQERMHELRATVSGVALSQRLLSDRRARLSRATKRRLERLREAELARIERLLADTPREQVALVDLGSVLDPLVDAVRLRGHPVLWDGTRCRAWVRADDFAEIAHILLDNAARHAGGRHIVLEVSDREQWIELRVSDGGPGVAPDLAPVVFERGTREATSRGQGIGLHIARRLAQDLGGDLRLAEPTPAATGAVFVLQLPEPTGDAPCLAPAV